jgi:hypothetical protein
MEEVFSYEMLITTNHTALDIKLEDFNIMVWIRVTMEVIIKVEAHMQVGQRMIIMGEIWKI